MIRSSKNEEIFIHFFSFFVNKKKVIFSNLIKKLNRFWKRCILKESIKKDLIKKSSELVFVLLLIKYKESQVNIWNSFRLWNEDCEFQKEVLRKTFSFEWFCSFARRITLLKSHSNSSQTSWFFSSFIKILVNIKSDLKKKHF